MNRENHMLECKSNMSGVKYIACTCDEIEIKRLKDQVKHFQACDKDGFEQVEKLESKLAKALEKLGATQYALEDALRCEKEVEVENEILSDASCKVVGECSRLSADNAILTTVCDAMLGYLKRKIIKTPEDMDYISQIESVKNNQQKEK